MTERLDFKNKPVIANCDIIILDSYDGAKYSRTNEKEN